MRVLVGPRAPVPPDGTKRAITVNNATVGWVIASPVERLTRNTDINFDKQQRQTSWLIVALSTLLAALATFPLARGLLAPVKRLVEGTHKLAAGDFSTRVDTRSQDELGKLAQDFNQLASTLEKNQQMRRDFMADISHELRTPLAVLRGELEAIQDGVRQFTPESVASLQAEVGTLTKLVDDLHQLSMSDEGALAYQKAPIDVINVLEVASGAFRERFASRNLKIDLSLPDSAIVFGDRDRLMQLFNNCWKTACAIPTAVAGCIFPASTETGALPSPLRIPHLACRIHSWKGCLSVFIVPKVRATAPAAAPGWGWRFASTSSRPITAQSAPPIRLLAGLALQ
jgi:two-component system sensor histidine kinase BaeS